MTCFYRARYRQALGRCSITIINAKKVEASAYHAFDGIEEEENVTATSDMTQDENNETKRKYLQVTFLDMPQRGIAPGQSLVLYRHDGLCFGGAPIKCGGPTYWERTKPLPLSIRDENSMHDWSKKYKLG